MDTAWAGVLGPGGDRESLPSVAPHLHTEAGQQLQGDVDVGFGYEFAHHLDHDVLRFGYQRQCQQQGGQELAGHVTAHANRRVDGDRRLADVQRRVALIAQVAHVAAQLAQGVHQVADGALVHAWNAAELEVSPQYR